jgi:RNA polymerase sigma-70 factor (ECF subfamily)
MPKRFRIAVSFAGQKREFVDQLACILAKKFGEDAVLYDRFHAAEFARADFAAHLPELYHKQADLVVAVICKDPGKWIGLDWRALLSLRTKRHVNELIFCRFDRAQGEGLPDFSSYLELDNVTPELAAAAILQRLAINEGLPADHVYPDLEELESNTYQRLAESSRPSDHEWWVRTRWSIVGAAAVSSSEDGERAFEWLCQVYGYSLYAYARQGGRTPGEAEHLVQGFFEQLRTNQVIRDLRAERGSFRAFLKVSFDTYCKDASTKESGNKDRVSKIALGEAEAEERYQRDFTDPVKPQRGFDRIWAMTLIQRVLDRLRAEMEAEGRSGRFAVLQPFLSGDREGVMETKAAEQLGLSPAAIKAMIQRMRVRFRELVHEEVRQTVSSPEHVATELRELYGALGG